MSSGPLSTPMLFSGRVDAPVLDGARRRRLVLELAEVVLLVVNPAVLVCTPGRTPALRAALAILTELARIEFSNARVFGGDLDYTAVEARRSGVRLLRSIAPRSSSRNRSRHAGAMARRVTRVLLSTRDLDVDVRVAARADRYIRDGAVPLLLSKQAGKLSHRQAAE